MDLLDLEGLTDEERTIILNVIRKDEELRRRQENRISQIKHELHNLRMNGVLRSGDDLSKICARCKNAFGLITNTGEMCPVCRFRVCKNCRESLLTQGWMCTLCFKENQLRWLSGDWMVQDKGKNHKSRFTNGTDLVRASLRIKRHNGRFSSDYADYEGKGKSEKEEPPNEKTSINKGSLGGLEERAGHNNGSRAGAVGRADHHPHDSPDKKRLSNLFDSIRSGLGGGSDDDVDSPAVGAMGGGAAGCGVVVQHVSCRRRRDSNSSSDSESRKEEEEEERGSKKSSSQRSGTAVVRHETRSKDKAAHFLDGEFRDRDAKISSLSHSQSSDVSASTVRERGVEGGRESEQSGSRIPIAKCRTSQHRKSELPQPVRTADTRQRREDTTYGAVPRRQVSDEERPKSGCSFTSSEWGDVTPTESMPSLAAQPSQDKKEEVSSALGQSSGYMSTSRRSMEAGDSNLNYNNHHQPLSPQDTPSPHKYKTLPSKLPVMSRQDSKDSRPEASQPETTHQTGNSHSNTLPTKSHIRRQSSGRSETLSTCSAKTASPATKMRLLDLASNRALDRDGSDSVHSWSGGSEDTMSLGMSCSGMQPSPEVPMFQRVHHKRQKGYEEGSSEGSQLDTSGSEVPVSPGEFVSPSKTVQLPVISVSEEDKVAAWLSNPQHGAKLARGPVSRSPAVPSGGRQPQRRDESQEDQKKVKDLSEQGEEKGQDEQTKETDVSEQKEEMDLTEKKEEEEDEEQDAGTDSAYSTAGSTAASVHAAHTDTKNSAGNPSSLATISPEPTEASPRYDSVSSQAAPQSESAAQNFSEKSAEASVAKDTAEREGNDYGRKGEDVITCDHANETKETASIVSEERDREVTSCSDKNEIHSPSEPALKLTQDPAQTLPDKTPTSSKSRPLSVNEVEGEWSKRSEDGTTALEEQMAEAEKMRSPEYDLPYTMQRYFMGDDSASDTLSIISERTEPEENGTETDIDEACSLCSDDSDSEGTVHDGLDDQWSDDCNDVIDTGITTPRKLSTAGADDAELLALQHLQEAQKHQLRPDEQQFVTTRELQTSLSKVVPNVEDIQQNEQVQQDKNLSLMSKSPSLAVSSTQTEEVLVISKDEQDQDSLSQASGETGVSSRSISLEESSTQTDEIPFQHNRAGNIHTQLEEDRPEVPSAVENQTRTEAYPKDHHTTLNAPDHQEVKPEDAMDQQSKPVPYEVEKGQEAEEEFELRYDKEDSIQNLVTPHLADSFHPDDSHLSSLPSSGKTDDKLGEEPPSDHTEMKSSYHSEHSDGQANNAGFMEQDEIKIDCAKDASILDEALFLDREEADNGGFSGALASGADGANPTNFAGQDSEVHAVDSVEHDAILVTDRTNSLEASTGVEARSGDMSFDDSDSYPTNMHDFVAVHRAYTELNDDQVSGGSEGEVPDSSTVAKMVDDQNSSKIQTPHDSDHDGPSKQLSSYLTENKSDLQLQASVDFTEAFSDQFLPEAEVDLDDPHQWPHGHAVVASDSGGFEYTPSPDLSGSAMLSSASEESVRQFSSSQSSSPVAYPKEVVSSVKPGTLLATVVLLGAAHEAEGQRAAQLNQSQLSDGDHTGTSDQSDAGPGSPATRPGSTSGTPQRSSRISIPSVVTTSHTGSIDERSFEDDDDNIDELFAKHRKGSRLGFSRSSIGDSRESLASVYSDAGEINYGRIPVSGEITFGLEYDHKLSALKINLKGCSDLAPVDIKHNRSDPYVKVYLLPDKTRSGKRKSKIKKHTLSPVYNETLTYSLSQGELENRTLWVTVWHSDRFGRNDFLGEVTIPMDMYRFEDTTPRAYTLQSRMPDTMSETAMQYKGDLMLSLMYVTPDKVAEGKKSKSKSRKSKAATESQGEIHAMIKSAKNLTAARSNGMSDPFVKGYLLPDRGRTGKQKTPVVKNSVNPMWNHILIFDNVDAMELADRSLELTIWDHEKLGTNEFLGGARLNLGMGSVKGSNQVDWMDARGEESIAWQNMMERPNTWIDAKLPLRASMGKATAKK